jgi:hypothetical protein
VSPALERNVVADRQGTHFQSDLKQSRKILGDPKPHETLLPVGLVATRAMQSMSEFPEQIRGERPADGRFADHPICHVLGRSVISEHKAALSQCEQPLCNP